MPQNDHLSLGALGKAKSCKHLVAIELACRSLNKLFSRDKLIELSRVGSKDFQQAVNNSKSLLKLTFTKTAAIDILAVQAGVEYKKPALELLRNIEIVVEKFDKARQALINLESAEYQVCCLVVSRSKKAAERNKVCNMCDITPKLVQNIVHDLERMRAGRAMQQGEGAESQRVSNGVVHKSQRYTKGQSQQRALKLSTLSLQSGGLNTETGPKVAKRARPGLKLTWKIQKSNMTLDTSEPLTSLFNRLTDPASIGNTTFGVEKGAHRQSAHEAARAQEAEKSRRAAEEQQREANMKRARFENWKQDILKKKKVA